MSHPSFRLLSDADRGGFCRSTRKSFEVATERDLRAWTWPDAIWDRCTDVVFERGENSLAKERICEIHRIDTTVSGSRQYDVRVNLAADGFDPWCDCPYDRPGVCKHVVAVLLRCLADQFERAATELRKELTTGSDE